MKMSLSAARRSNLLRRAIGVGIFEQLEQRRMLSVTPLGPIPSETQSSNPSQFFVVGGTTLFFADDATGQQHLYKTDGTTAGTQLVSTQGLDNSTSGGADIAVSGNNLFYITDTGNGQQIEEATVGTGGAITMTQFTNIVPDNNLNRYDIESIVPVGSNVYYWTDDNSNASGDTTPITLWVSDGTTSTNLGSFSEIDDLAGINGKAVISANDGTNGQELWVSDGTALGTVPIQLNGNQEINGPEDFVADGTNLFFEADAGQLYYTDGTQTGTNQVAGAQHVLVNGPSFELNTSEHISVLSGDVYYSNNGPLYKTSADGQTTTQVSTAVYDAYYITPMGANIYFQGQDDTHGRELWKSDGSSGGTDLVEDINTGTGSSFPEGLTASGNELFFQAEPDGENDQIFATDGTTVTQLTQRVGDGDDFENLISSGGSGVAYTSINDGFHGNEPFKLTATTASLLADVNATPGDESESPDGTAQVGNILYFVSGDDDNQTLWKTDGTAAGTVQVNIPVTMPGGSTSTTAVVNGLNIDDLIGGTSTLYFRTNADGNNDVLWAYDGTTTAPVKAVLPGSATPADVNVTGDSTVVGNTLFFVFDDGTHGDELWKSDGTTTGTTIVKDINTVDNGSDGTDDSNPSNLWAFGNKLLFTANDGLGQEQELWVTDGTSAGTMVIKHLLPGTTTNLDIDDLALVGNIAYFNVDNDGETLWKTDGTAAGTVMLAKFDELDLPDFGSEGISAPPVINGNFFFNAESFTGSDAGQELWKTDGTPAGTVLVKSGRSGNSDSGGFDPENMINLNPTTIVFSAYGPDGNELFKSDGTTAGTVQVADINAGKADSEPEDLTVLNGEVYFSALTGNTGILGEDRELWKSDGTAAGTTEVKQLYTRTGYYTSGGADVEDITVVGSKIFFTANDSVHGQELWETDGTAAGTSLVQDINDTDSSFPSDFTPLVTPAGDNALVFFADDGSNGEQPFSVVVPSYALNVSTTSLSVPENGSNTFTVDLTAMPASNVTVTINKETGGSADLSTATTTLTFTPANWDDPQTVTVAGALDDGALNSTATFDISSPNLSTDTVAATEIANTTGIVVIGSNAVSVPEGGTGTFSVHLSSAPLTSFTVTIARTAGDSILTSAPATLVFTPANFATDQTVTLTSGTDSDTNNDTATFTVSDAGFPDQTVTATQIDNSGPRIGTFIVTPATGSSKSNIKLLASGITGDGGTGIAKDVVFYIDTNHDGVLDTGDAALKTVKPSKKGTASFALKAKTLSAGQTTFFAQAVDANNTSGQAASGTFTLNASSNVKKSARRNAPIILADSTQDANANSGGITQEVFSVMPILD
jgi:ELWxxDGT repeat protein